MLLNKETHTEKLIRWHQFAELTITHAYTETQIGAPLLLRMINPIITPEIYPTARAFFQELVEQNRQTLKQKKLPPPDFYSSKQKNALLDLIVLPRLQFFAMMNT